jgi:hypothetical protein
MKRIAFLLIIVMAVNHKSYSQQYNWNAFAGQKGHIFSLNYGLVYGMTACLGYGHSMSIAKLPLILAVDYSFPSGNKIFDDFKIRTGFQLSSPNTSNFRAIANVYAVYRRLESDFTRQFNIGSDLGLLAGYFKPGFFVAGEFGFDKAITSNIKQKGMYLDIYPEAKNGWYIPMGGNYYYGLQVGYSPGKMDFILRIGQTRPENNMDQNFLPYYLNLGVNFRISKIK